MNLCGSVSYSKKSVNFKINSKNWLEKSFMSLKTDRFMILWAKKHKNCFPLRVRILPIFFRRVFQVFLL